MTPESMADTPVPAPAPARQIGEPDSLDTRPAAWARAFFFHPSRVAAALASTGALAIFLVVAGAVAALVAAVRVVIGERLPRWSLHVDVASGNLLVSVAVAASATKHVDLANLYLLVALFAVLYLPLRGALAHLATAGVAYAVVLGVGAHPAEPPIVAWLSVFGSAAVLSVIVVGLVSALRSTAREDPLTGLANRRMWDERFEEEMERSARSDTALSVLVADLDGFKAVNDAGGHEAGDRVLQDLARAWREVVRGAGDFLARLGGDEFGLLAPDLDEIGARSLAKRLADAIPPGISASIGVATWDRSEGASDLLRRADRAMYRNKDRQGPNKGLLG
ncbi:MAG: GGDEF domain-containing protein [Actinomycetota bacterium]|nr:GGDEF domain-containing protein [Actinomycetota bacterium]